MKMKFMLCTMLCVLSISMAKAVPITQLILSDSDITVGEQFTVDVLLENDIANEELLSFGFAVDAVDPNLAYLGYTVGVSFFDLSLAPDSLAGLAFPGVTDNQILLASLSFEALNVGAASVSVNGIFDAMFAGLFYENSGFDIQASVQFDVSQASNSVSAPAVSGLFALLCLLVYQRKLRANE